MKMTRVFMPVFLFGLLFTSCSKEDEVTDNPQGELPKEETRNLEVEKFIYSGMNEIYLYKADVPELADDYFSSDDEKDDFLESFDSPEDLYDGIQSSQDRFSFMTNDYIALENSFKGVSKTTGMNYSLGIISGTDNVWGIVRYVLPGTSAEAEGVKRGDVFTEVNGTQLTRSNYQDLLASSTITIDINYIENNTITPTGETKTLSNVEYTANPVYIAKTFDVNGSKAGYLMYNSFTANFDDELNAAFAQFKSEGITDLILDLRYNGGGSVATAVGLAGMITGQFKGEIFLREQWNEKYQNAWESESYVNRFKDKITIHRGTDDETEELLNSLQLNKVYVLTSRRSASASELVINGLEPYIDVVQIGDVTTGKFQASVTLYDSPNFGRTGANPNHRYAIQPLVMKSANRDGISDYINGLTPDVKIVEDLSNYGELGSKDELLLGAALNHIAGLPQDEEKAAQAQKLADKFRIFGESGMELPTYQRMYLEKLPVQLERDLE